RHHNELTKFRYNVVLNVGSNQPSTKTDATFEWQRDSLTLGSLRDILASDEYESFLIQNVPNSRVVGELKVLRSIRTLTDKTVADLKLSASEFASEGFDPEELCLLGEALSYRALLFHPFSFNNSYFDVVFARPGSAAAAPGSIAFQPDYDPLPIPKQPDGVRLKPYVNNPLQGPIAARLAPQLKRFLSERLPDYMVPSEVVVLESLPRNSNGKVDRKSLRRRSGDRPDLSAGFAGPVSPDEELIAGIFSQLLGRDRVGVTENFFDIGGHSLRATQAVSAIRNIFGIEIPLTDFFAAPTSSALSRKVAAARAEGAGAALPNIQPASRGGELAPLSFAQQRLWFIDQLSPGTAVYNLPLAIRMKGNVSLPALTQAMSEVVRRHETLRTSFTDRDGPHQFVHSYSQVNPLLGELSGLHGNDLDTEARRLSSVERERPFDLDRGPLVRFTVLPLDDQEYALLITMHHIISDGWSVTVLLDEISRINEAFSSGDPSPLSELEIQYADYCCWQRDWVDADTIDRQASFWKERLGECPVVVEIPTDRPRPPIPSYAGATLPVTIPGTIASAVKELARSQGATVFMVLLGGFQALLHRYTGENTILTGTPVAGRSRT
ncbi:MAG: condensation domain-containing protein, partial [Blastocatellia bacterium]